MRLHNVGVVGWKAPEEGGDGGTRDSVTEGGGGDDCSWGENQGDNGR